MFSLPGRIAPFSWLFTELVQHPFGFPKIDPEAGYADPRALVEECAWQLLPNGDERKDSPPSRHHPFFGATAFTHDSRKGWNRDDGLDSESSLEQDFMVHVYRFFWWLADAKDTVIEGIIEPKSHDLRRELVAKEWWKQDIRVDCDKELLFAATFEPHSPWRPVYSDLTVWDRHTYEELHSADYQGSAGIAGRRSQKALIVEYGEKLEAQRNWPSQQAFAKAIAEAIGPNTNVRSVARELRSLKIGPKRNEEHKA